MCSQATSAAALAAMTGTCVIQKASDAPCEGNEGAANGKILILADLRALPIYYPDASQPVDAHHCAGIARLRPWTRPNGSKSYR